jgi:Fe-S cluster biogenesis protein NfuA
MIVKADVEKALDGLRQGFKADGADLRVDDVSGSTVSVRLIGTDETCWECIVPPEQLRNVVSTVLRNDLPAVRSVELIDPRA